MMMERHEKEEEEQNNAMIMTMEYDSWHKQHDTRETKQWEREIVVVVVVEQDEEMPVEDTWKNR